MGAWRAAFTINLTVLLWSPHEKEAHLLLLSVLDELDVDITPLAIMTTANDRPIQWTTTIIVSTSLQVTVSQAREQLACERSDSQLLLLTDFANYLVSYSRVDSALAM